MKSSLSETSSSRDKVSLVPHVDDNSLNLWWLSNASCTPNTTLSPTTTPPYRSKWEQSSSVQSPELINIWNELARRMFTVRSQRIYRVNGDTSWRVAWYSTGLHQACVLRLLA